MHQNLIFILVLATTIVSLSGLVAFSGFTDIKRVVLLCCFYLFIFSHCVLLFSYCHSFLAHSVPHTEFTNIDVL